MRYLIAMVLVLVPSFSANAITADDAKKFNASQKLRDAVCEDADFTSDVYFAEVNKANLRTGYITAIREYKPYVMALEACQDAHEAHTERIGKLLGKKHKAYKILKRLDELSRIILNKRIKMAQAKRREQAYLSTLVPGYGSRLQPSEYKERYRLLHIYFAASDEFLAAIESQKNEIRKLLYEWNKGF